MNTQPYMTAAYIVAIGMLSAYLLSLAWQWYAIARRGGGPGDEA